jgi:CheY-like chemotaxis protein
VKRILFVDDEPDVRQFVEHVLTSSGHEVELAEDGVVGLEKLQQRRPDLILLDIMMPNLDGWGVLERLPEIPDAPPVILLTARDDVASFARAFKKGVAAFINKPFRFAELIDTCQRVLEASHKPVEDERRSEQRHRVGLGVRVLSDGGIPLAMGELLDLSRHGARVRLGAPRDVGSEVWLALYMSSGQTALQLSGTVRWCSGEAGSFVLGLALGELSPETQERLDELFGAPAAE